MAGVTTTIRLEQATRQKLEEAARADDRSLSYVIQKAVQQFLNERTA